MTEGDLAGAANILLSSLSAEVLSPPTHRHLPVRPVDTVDGQLGVIGALLDDVRRLGELEFTRLCRKTTK